MKYSIVLKQSGSFASNPRFAELEDEKICPDDAHFPDHILGPGHRFNPHNVQAFVLGHEHGAICMVFASSEQDAWDAACDKGWLEMLQVEEQDSETEEGIARFGNASEPHDITHAWAGYVEWEVPRDIHLIMAIWAAYHGGEDSL